MRNDTLYGSALILSVLGLIMTAALHPTGQQVVDSAESAERFGLLAAGVHALALTSVGVTSFGLVGLARRLGLERPDVAAAAVAWAMAIMAVICAASFSGFVGPAVAKAIFAAEQADRHVLKQFFDYNGMLNQAFAKFHVVASSVAIVLWSIAMLRTGFGRALGVVGCVVPAVTVGALVSGRLVMDVHGLAIVEWSQGLWLVWSGVLMVRTSARVA
jgi:hypothetical protein